MKKKILMTMLSAITVLSFSAQSFAADIHKAGINNAGEKITVSGKINNPGGIVTIQLVKDENFSSLEAMDSMTSPQLQSAYAYAAQVTADKEGKFTVEIPVVKETSDSGKYKVIVSGDGTVAVQDAVLKSVEDVNTILSSKLQQCTAASAVESFFADSLIPGENQDSDLALGFEREVTENLGSRERVYGNMAEFIANNTLSTANLGTLVDIYRSSAAITALNEMSDTSDTGIENARAVMDEYEDVLKCENMAAYPTYANEASADYVKVDFVDEEGFRNSVDAQCIGKSLTDTDNFTDYRNKVTILTALDNLVSYNGAGNVILNNKAYLDSKLSSADAFNWSGYNSLGSDRQANVKKAITKKGFKSLEELSRAFNGAVTTELQSLAPSVLPGNNYGGGGGGSGGGGGVTVQAYVPDNIEQKSLFTDMISVPWAVESVTALSEHGIVNGVGDGKFAPNDNVTREQLVKMLVSGFGIDTGNSSCDFSDVLSGEWYYKYISAGVDSGMVNGIGNGLFGVGRAISREDICVMAYRCLTAHGVTLNGEGKSFGDSDSISDYAIEAVNSLSGAGIINGNENGQFLPKNTATRAEAAKIIYGVLKLSGKI